MKLSTSANEIRVDAKRMGEKNLRQTNMATASPQFISTSGWFSYTFATFDFRRVSTLKNGMHQLEFLVFNQWKSGPKDCQNLPLHRIGKRQDSQTPEYFTITNHRHHAQVCEPTFQLNMFNHQSILIPMSLNFRSIASLFARVIHKLLKSNWGLWNWVYHCIWDDL